MNRISIIGGSGTGKTTLANNLGKELHLPIYHLDSLNYFANWEERDKQERDKIIQSKIAEDKWIIDGTYRSTLEQRLKASDLVIYLDYSSIAQIKGVMTRWLKSGGKEKSEIPGCEEKMDREFFFSVLKWRKNKRKDVLKCIEKIDKEKILVFKNRYQLDKWYKNTFNKKIEI